MYFDSRACRECGREVELRAHEPDEDEGRNEPDSTVDERVCTNPDCPTNAGGSAAPRP